ncbi:MAG: VOC family protein [Eubacteriales bacterium]
MIKGFLGINISSKDPKKLVEFYKELLGVPVQFDGYGDYDGAQLGFVKNTPVICIWNEEKWGKYEGLGNFVFICDNLDDTYMTLKEKDIEVEPPYQASWGGKEMKLSDPEGHKMLLIEVNS